MYEVAHERSVEEGISWFSSRLKNTHVDFIFSPVQKLFEFSVWRFLSTNAQAEPQQLVWTAREQ